MARGRDLAVALLNPGDADAKRRMLEATAALLGALERCGARHPDLNLKNVLLAPAADGAWDAWVLDVDRIVFERPGDARVARANFERLARSARKWRDLYGADVTDADLDTLASAAARAAREAR